VEIGVDGLVKRDDDEGVPTLLPMPLTIRGDCGVEGRCWANVFEWIGRVDEELSSSSSLDAV
jgi:hypothetical protein